jgi:flagellin-specific chaperone FliS
MENYNEIKKKESILKKKEVLLDDTIKKGRLSQFEIISKMYEGLVNEIESLRKDLFQDLKVTNKAKDRAEKISKIVFSLQSCLDMENGDKIAEDLNWLYRYIRYMTKRLQDNEDMNYVQPAHTIAKDLQEAWNSIPSADRQLN